MPASSDFTLRLLVDAGLRPGMHVLGVGCGSGDVTFPAASLVGQTGSVIGVDRDANALKQACDRGVSQGPPTPVFLHAGIAAPPRH